MIDTTTTAAILKLRHQLRLCHRCHPFPASILDSLCHLHLSPTLDQTYPMSPLTPLTLSTLPLLSPTVPSPRSTSVVALAVATSFDGACHDLKLAIHTNRSCHHRHLPRLHFHSQPLSPLDPSALAHSSTSTAVSFLLTESTKAASFWYQERPGIAGSALRRATLWPRRGSAYETDLELIELW